jgi:hypothetical protein
VSDPVAWSQQRALELDERLQKTYRSEETKVVAFEDFETYFKKFFAATALVRPFTKVRWVFPIDKPQTEYWTVDFGKAAIERSAELPADYDSKVTVSAAVLSGSLRNTVFTNVDISKRWRVYVRRGSAMRHFVITNLLLLYEAEYLSPKHVLSWRFLSGYARRFPEVLDYARMALRTATKGKDSLVEAVTSIAEG